MEENLYAPPKAAVSDGVSGAHDADLHFFAVSPIKMVVLSVCTLGIYQIYWFYKHWVLIREHSEPLIVPLGARLFRNILVLQLLRIHTRRRTASRGGADIGSGTVGHRLDWRIAGLAASRTVFPARLSGAASARAGPAAHQSHQCAGRARSRQELALQRLELAGGGHRRNFSRPGPARLDAADGWRVKADTGHHAMTDSAAPAQSPCIRNCCLDDDDTCLGCFDPWRKSSSGDPPAN